MHAASFEHGQEARQALHAIVGDPLHGAAALASPRILAGLLGDLLPDAPRETGLLLAAAEKDVPGALREHVRHGMDVLTAISLTASALAASTAFGPEVCEWVTTEFAIALDLGITEQHPPTAAPARHPAGGAPAQHPPTEHAGLRLPGMPGGAPPPGAAQPRPPASSPRRRSWAAIAVLASAVIVALAMIGYALIRRSADAGRPAAGRKPPAISTSGTRAPPSASPSASSPTAGSASSPTAGSAASSVPGGQSGLRGTPATWNGIWIAQLASVPTSAGQAQLNSMLAKVRLEVPSAQVLTSTGYASLNPYYWVIYYAGGFSDGAQALRFCAAHGRISKNECIGRYVSHDHGDIGYQCYPPAAAPTASCFHSPASAAEVVESYITAINTRDWREVWQLGGKNLGQSYRQMIANYAQTSRVLISRLTARGDTVAVQSLAYETDGAAQRYALRYNVSDGVIVAGRATLIATG